ncbi:hypothetical protein GH865_00915 [Rhodocyclus tenuis]|uniref:hypothetical protein n=1 Tax=Rhodocyclus gracilis TaxID=2929842 RepID=UPI001298BD86|nr:hypothetical protein [Rhodocyclus gracilis]MRD71817.1 hypothetical protein [Rhodocyclus gracilis]
MNSPDVPDAALETPATQTTRKGRAARQEQAYLSSPASGLPPESMLAEVPVATLRRAHLEPPPQSFHARIDPADARRLAEDALRALQMAEPITGPSSSPELPPDSRPRVIDEICASFAAAANGDARAARWVTIGGFGSLVLAAASVPSLPGDDEASGRIAAAHALSGVLGVGVRPTCLLFATEGSLDDEGAAALLRGAQAVAAEIRLGVHPGECRTVRGDAVCAALAIARVPPARVGQRGAREGDTIILAKAQGIGILLEMWRAGGLSGSERASVLASASQLLTPAPLLACFERVHVLAGIGERGVLGSLLDLCATVPGGAHAFIDAAVLPLHAGAAERAVQTGAGLAAQRNLARHGARLQCVAGDPPLAGNAGLAAAGEAAHDVAPTTPAQALAAAPAPADESVESDASDELAAAPDAARSAISRLLLADAQPGVGLLVCCPTEGVSEVLAVLLQMDFGHAAPVGKIVAGAGDIRLLI